MELMMTLAIAAVILAFAAPSFREFRMNGRMTTAANDLLTSLQQARSEAVKRQRTVAVCASADPFANAPQCSDEFAGWLVWVDLDGDSTIDAGEDVLARHGAPGSGLELRADAGFISYAPSGFSRSAAGGARGARVILLCDERGDAQNGTDFRKRVLSVSRTGRPAIVKSVSAVTTLDEALEDEELGFDFACAQGGGS